MLIIMTKNFHYFKTLMSTCCIFQKVQLSMSMLTVKVKSLKSAETTSTLLTQRFSSRPNCFKTINSQIIFHLTKMSLLQNDRLFSSYKNVTNGSCFFMTTEKCDQDEMDQLQIFLWHCNFQQKTDQLAHSTSTQID